MAVPSSKAAESKKLLYTFLDLIDKLDDKILIIGTTHNYKDIDPSLRRGGRLDFEVRFDMPEPEDRVEIFEIHLGSYTHSISHEEIV